MAVAEHAIGVAPQNGGRVDPSLPPGPRMSPFLQTLAWTVAPTWFMRRCARTVGDHFTMTFFPSGMRFVMVADPDAVKEVFTAPPGVAPSAAGNSPIRPVVGPSSVLVTVGEEHLRQRKLLLPPFHGERMREYEETIVAATRADMAEWPRGRAMKVQPRSRAITLEVILTAVFGVGDERREPLRRAISELLAPVNMLAVLRIALSRPTGERPGGKIGAALDALDAVLYAEIRARRAAGDLGERSDILSLLLQARDEEGEAMSDSELRDELVTLLLAGHETTATSVAWAIERLVRHPEKLARLQAEIDAGDSEEYMTAVVNETLRVRPVVPIVARQLKEDLEVGGRVLPAGTTVAPCIYLTNRNPRVYERPEEFMPERFLKDGPETFSWIPFGGGIRRCIGAAFAQLEMKLILRTVLSELTPRLEGPWRRPGELTRRRAITMVPMAGARVVWDERSRI
ncbi:MAG TPA: cytochrome P450 [Solirubrobacteraceae bacterium]|nr:cytochrome P450 [Solirubrobacteraceae bacterium]